MTNVFITSNTTSATYTNSDTTVMVYPNVVVNYLAMEASGSQLFNNGTIGISDGTLDGSVFANNGLSFNNSGTVLSNFKNAVLLGGEDDANPQTDATYTITNSGTIECDDAADRLDAGIQIESGQGHNIARITNEAGGSIRATVYGIESSAQTFTLDNAGSITARSGYGVSTGADTNTIRNSGTIAGPTTSIFAAGANVSVSNSGTLLGTVGFGSPLSGTGTSRFFNSGSLDGDVYAQGADTFQVVNRGSIDGDFLINTDSANETIRNTGTISGNVKLGSGTNTFDGRNGSIDGYIQGGTGADTIKAGSDGETIAGGAGHDTLYGGSGADTFAFTSFASGDTDRVYQFNTLADIIRLNHSTFTKLTAGQTPTFTVGSSASSPTDYLFYNSSTGGLFYDADGNGAGAAHKIADFDAGLKLTAHDFKVV